MSTHDTPTRSNRNKQVTAALQNNITDGDGNERYQFRAAGTVADIITRTTRELDLTTDAATTAGTYYRTIHNKDMVAGGSQETAIGACVRLASMHHGTPRPLAEIADVTGETTKTIRTKLSQFVREVDIDYQPVQPREYVDYLSDKLGLSPNHEIRSTAKEILDAQRTVDESFLFGKSPLALTASALYAATQLDGTKNFTQTDISDVSYISEVSIRTHYKTLGESYQAVQ